MRISIPGLTTSLLEDKTVNRTRNDYSYRSGWNPTMQLGQQYKLDVREARKLGARIESLPKSTALAVLKDLKERSTPAKSIHGGPDYLPAKGSVALSENAARELSRLATKLGGDIKFTHGQPRPMHPVG
jgi:hypothetical protein